MTRKILDTCKVAILATNGFEQSELFEPKEALEAAGAEVKIVSPFEGEIRAWKGKDWGKFAKVDLSLEDAPGEAFDALMLPGGVMNPDQLRINEDAVEFVKTFTSKGKPIAAICHGLWTLLETGHLRGKTVTSWPSLKTDLINAGAMWVDREVVVDNGVVTSRKPQDLPAFNAKMIEEFAEGLHAERVQETESDHVRI